MKTMKNLIIAVLAVIAVSSCSSIKITSDKDGSVDFDQHKTLSYYGWQEESDTILNRFEKERIEKAFGEEFRKRGFTLVERNGDIIVSLFIVVDQKRGTTAYTNHYGGGGPWILWRLWLWCRLGLGYGIFQHVLSRI